MLTLSISRRWAITDYTFNTSVMTNSYFERSISTLRRTQISSSRSR
jgi:hypothetical protein